MAHEHNDEQYAMLQVGRQRKCRARLDEMKSISACGYRAANDREDEEHSEEWYEMARLLIRIDLLLRGMEKKYDAEFSQW